MPVVPAHSLNADQAVVEALQGAALPAHPQNPFLQQFVAAPTAQGSDGFPRVGEPAVRLFLDHVPHLFGRGESILQWVADLNAFLDADTHGLTAEQHASVTRAAKVLRQMVNTASVTAPCDLWLARQVLAVHHAKGTLSYLLQGTPLNVEQYARENGLEARQLGIDLEFLYTRGYLDKEPSGEYVVSSCVIAREVLEAAATQDFDERFLDDMTGKLRTWFADGQHAELVESWLRLSPATETEQTRGWQADFADMIRGYQTLPLVLALKAQGLLEGARFGDEFLPGEERFTDQMRDVFWSAGLLDGDNRVTRLGERVFSKGPGAFGIIGTYHPYLRRLSTLLERDAEKPHVARADNIWASRYANSRDFRLGAHAVKRFFEATDREPTVFIEHAVGLGEGLFQLTEVFGTEGITFVGADYEQDSLDGTQAEVDSGRLPAGTIFVQADIGEAGEFLKHPNLKGVSLEGAVMVVGNGFHEVRGNDARLVTALKKYLDAGIILVFTEQTGLTSQQMLATGFSSYNAGFTWTHETSGQTTRPEADPQDHYPRTSWRAAIEAAGGVVLEDYTHGTRRLVATENDDPAQNPRISVTYVVVKAV